MCEEQPNSSGLISLLPVTTFCPAALEKFFAWHKPVGKNGTIKQKDPASENVARPHFIVGVACKLMPSDGALALRTAEGDDVFTPASEYYLLRDYMVERLIDAELDTPGFLKAIHPIFSSAADEWAWRHSVRPYLLVEVAKKRHEIQKTKRASAPHCPKHQLWEQEPVACRSC